MAKLLNILAILLGVIAALLTAFPWGQIVLRWQLANLETQRKNLLRMEQTQRRAVDKRLSGLDARDGGFYAAHDLWGIFAGHRLANNLTTRLNNASRRVDGLGPHALTRNGILDSEAINRGFDEDRAAILARCSDCEPRNLQLVATYAALLAGLFAGIAVFLD